MMSQCNFKKLDKIKQYWWLITTIGTIIISIISCTLVVAKFYYNIENKYYEIEETINTNKQMSLKGVIWNSEIPIMEQLSACDIYINSGYNSLTKKYCENIVNEYKGRSIIHESDYWNWLGQVSPRIKNVY